MTARHNYSLLGAPWFLSLFTLISVGPTQTVGYGMSLLATGATTATTIPVKAFPNLPRPGVEVPDFAEAPRIEASPFASDVPGFAKPNLSLPPRPSVTEMRIRRAEARFQTGKRLFQQYDIDGARREFDGAVDILLGTPDKEADRLKAERKLEELVAAIHKYDINHFGAGQVDEPAYDRAPLEDILEMTFPVDPTLKPKVREQMMATTSQLPLQVTDAVLSYINFFSGEKGRRTLLAGLRRAGQYKPMISRILAEEGVPQELIYLAQAESGFLPRAVSRKAATGMWQFVQWRGREYGLQQTSYSDDRLDPEKATRSAARHLRDLYEKFGDWYLAIAGYNCGPGCVERAVERTGYADFWELRSRNAIPRETTNYVPIILAMTIMAKNPQAYGLEEIEIDAPIEYETVQITAPTHVTLIADAADRPVSELRALNPALLASVAPAGYEMRIPKGTRKLVASGIESIPEERRTSWRLHRVSPGEDLSSIARAYRVSTAAISNANRIPDGDLGDTLVIPSAPQPVKAVKLSAAKKKPAGRVSASRRNTKGSAAQRVSKNTKKRTGTVERASLR